MTLSLRAGFAVLIMATGACSTTRSTLPFSDAPLLSTQEVIQEVQAGMWSYPATVQIEADLSVRSPAFNGTVRADIMHRRGDTLYASLSVSALRIEAGRLWTTADSFYYHDRLERRVIYGPAAFIDLVMPGLFGGSAAYERLLGLLRPDADASWDLAFNAAQYELTRADARLRFTIDPSYWRVVLYEARTPDSTLLEALRYADFSSSGGHIHPMRVVLQRPGDGISVAASFRSVTFDPDRLDFSLRLPGDVPWVRVEDLAPSLR